MSFLRGLFSSNSPRLVDPEVQEMLHRQARALNAALMRALARKAFDRYLREANIRPQDLDPGHAAEIIAAIRSKDDSVEVPVTTVRLSQMLCEVVVATADRLDEEDAASIVVTLDALLPVLLGRPMKPDFAAGMFVLHGETVGAVLPEGWMRPLRDVPDFRDAGWGLLTGNAVAGVIISEGWKRRSDLEAKVADDVLSRLTEAPPEAPLPAQKPFFPRRHALRWTAAAVRARAELEAEAVRSRVEATAACLPRLLEAALGDRLQDRLLNGETPVGAMVEVPPVLGVAVIDMAARATAHWGELQPGAEVEAAASLASRLFGLSPPAAHEAAIRWAALWQALLARYEGASAPGLPDGDGYIALSYAQTRGRKLAEFVAGSRDPDDLESLAPTDIEIRAFARLFRFVELRGSDLPSLPKLGSWPAPDAQTAQAALLERFSAVRMPAALIEAWKDEHSPFRRRLQTFMAQLDRLLPYPELTDADNIDMATKFWKVDKATALEKLSVSVAVENEPWLIFLSVLCLRSFGDLVSAPADCFPLVKLAAERVHGPRADLMKVMSRNAWLAAEHPVAQELFARAQALLVEDDEPAASRTLQPLAELATSLAGVVRGDSPPMPGAEAAVRKRLLITPESLRAA